MSIPKNKITAAQVVYAHRCLQGKPGKPQPLRIFSVSIGLNHGTIHNWEKGRPINLSLIDRILTSHKNGWQSAFARDVLAALYPETYEPFNDLPQLVRQAQAFLNSKPR